MAGEKKEKYLIASQWQLVRWKFIKHKAAVGALIVLSLMYFCAIFAQVISPYSPRATDKNYIFTPPSKIRFIDEDKRFNLRPFIYGIKQELNMETLSRSYTEDRTKKYPISLFVKGDSCKLWGLFETRLHLFGTSGSRIYLFGADMLGRDLFSRILYGSQISLSIGLIGVAISFVLGITLGGISGYFGGKIDIIIQRIIEFIRSIPTLPLWMALSAALPPTWPVTRVYLGIVVILSFLGWTGLARVVRGKFMALREEDFVMAAQLYGASKSRIIFLHLLPSFYSHIIASLTLSIPGMIIGETSLSFIGLGLQAPAISWGVLLKDAQSVSVLANNQWMLIPGLFVIITVLAFNFVGDGLRDAADPYSTA